MKATTLCAVAVGLALTLTLPVSAVYDANKVQGGGGYMELFQAPTPVTGGYEYIVDFYTNGGGSQDYALWGFENDDVYNKFFKYGKTLPRHMWTWKAAYGQTPPALPPSLGGLYVYSPDGQPAVFAGTDEWTLNTDPEATWAMLNPWHLPSEYAGSFGAWTGPIGPEGEYYEEAGGPYWIPAYGFAEHNVIYDMVDSGSTYDSVQGGPGTASEDMLHIGNGAGFWGHGEGLLWTLRIVVPDLLVDGDLSWSMPSYGDPHLDAGVYDVLWASGTTTPGDFDGDGDVDTDDIDILCDNLGDNAFDLDGDGDAAEDDMVFLIQNLVELTDGSGRTGTEVGDFNLDGLINATDLATMAATFGATPPPELLYGDGNANCDELINATDLAILAANFGYVAPAGAVPEPMTVSLLAMGAAAILRRKS